MRRLAALAAAAAALAAAPASAHAFTVSVQRAAPADVKAGATTDFTLTAQFGDSTPKDLAIDLPPGLIGDPNAATRCPIATFTAGGCTAASAVGTANASVTAVGIPVNATGTVYNLAPAGNEPARLGIALQAAGSTIYSQSPVSVRPDGGLTSTVTDLPRTQGGLPISIASLSLTLRGKVAGGKSFIRNPTSCGPATTTVRAVPYDGQPASGTASFTPTSCDALPFAPKLTASIGGAGQTREGGKPGLTTVITQAAGEAGTKSVAVTLPAGIASQITALARACTKDQLAAGACPAASEIGTGEATVPVLSKPLAGKVRLVQGEGALPDVEVELTGQITQRLRGVVTAGANGLTTTFDGIPDVPLSRFALTFSPGDAGLLQSQRDLCAKANPPLTGVATSQGGVQRPLSVVPSVTGCKKSGSAKSSKRLRASVGLSRVGGARGKRVQLRVSARGVGAKLRRVTVTLPGSLRLSPGDVKARGPKGASLKVRSSRTLRVTLPAAGASRVTLRVLRGLRATPALRRAKVGRELRVQVAATFRGGGSDKAAPTVRTRR